MVMSVLLYGAETWPVTKKEIRKLTTFQMRCLRDILGVTLWHRHHNSDILRETGEPPVEDQLRQKRLQWFGHMQRMPDHRVQCNRCCGAAQKERKGCLVELNSDGLTY